MPVPARKLIAGPRQRFVQVAEVASIGPSGGKLIGHPGTAHLMAANRRQDTVCRMRHVTIITLASVRSGLVMSVSGYFGFRAEPFVTLRASPIVRAVRDELIVRLTVVWRVTRQAGELAAAVTGRLD